jgi:DNA helicase-2/ATP-dependent DNA helicase PcrA
MGTRFLLHPPPPARKVSRFMSVVYQLQPTPPGDGFHLDYARLLNPEQHAAATAGAGPLLVIAGAGSGKTRTLTYRVAYLIENGIPPDRILLLTFTNKAAREMLSRVADIIPHDISRLWGGTFHHVGNRILRRHAREAGLQPDFTILDRDDSEELLRACLPHIGVDTKSKLFPKPGALMEFLSFAANTRLPFEHLFESDYNHLAEHGAAISRLAVEYAARKRRANAADYDDLLALPVNLFRDHPSIAERYQDQWLYVLVDEYQDTNTVQGEFIDAVVAKHHNLMAVGDDAQSIYAWRGANFRNILEFQRRYPDAQVHRIETNYRSTPGILELANASIARNVNQFRKNLRSVKPDGAAPALVSAADAEQQAGFIAQRAVDLREEGRDLRDIAILYRAHSHAIELQLELTRRGIPFTITSGLPFFSQAHTKDVAAFLRLASNPSDEISFKRIVRMLPGIGDAAAEKLWNQLGGRRDWSGANVPRKSEPLWQQLVLLMQQLATQPAPSPGAMTGMVLDSFYGDYLKTNYENAPQRIEDLKQFQGFAGQYDQLTDLLEQLALMTNLDAMAAGGGSADGDAVKLSTIHQAKGLEWPVVFVIMLCDGLFPLARASQREDQLEEERRLFYVATTRACDELYLCWPQMRFTRSGGGDIFQRRSRFVDELPTALMEEWRLAPPANPWMLKGSGSSRPRNDDPPWEMDDPDTRPSVPATPPPSASKLKGSKSWL